MPRRHRVKVFLTDHACRRWNRRRALGNLLTLAGIVAAGLFLAYLLLSWLAGEPW